MLHLVSKYFCRLDVLCCVCVSPQKGCGYHLDLFVVGVMLGVCSLMGLPWFVAATVLSISHVNSLKLESECSAPGEQPKFLGIREQRFTGLMIFVLMGSSVFMTSVLKVSDLWLRLSQAAKVWSTHDACIKLLRCFILFEWLLLYLFVLSVSQCLCYMVFSSIWERRLSGAYRYCNYWIQFFIQMFVGVAYVILVFVIYCCYSIYSYFVLAFIFYIPSFNFVCAFVIFDIFINISI